MSDFPATAQNATRSTLRLLLPLRSAKEPDQPSIELLGQRWVLEEYSGSPQILNAPQYTCVSYSWGPRQAPHPFDKRQSMSDRTISAAEDAVRFEETMALWIDALCMPFEEPARSICLSRMGSIYGQASLVVVVLSAPCAGLMEQIASTGRVEPESLLTFERDDWLTRVWTHQELVNCGNIRFVAEGGGGVSAGAEEVLNHVGHALQRYKNAQGYDAYTMAAVHPRLHRLEDLLLDWKMSGYLKRSAYQVMSGMAGRDSTQPEEQFYAMVGALSDSFEECPADPTAAPAEYFMQVCESKGDYSFIYTSAARSDAPGRHWRPAVAKRFPAVFPWATYGHGQTGRAFPSHLQLNEMWCPTPGTPTPEAEHFIVDWLQTVDVGPSPDDLPAQVLERLEQAGFTGCGEHIELENGHFFPFSAAPDTDHVVVAIATGLQMRHGALGLLLGPGSADLHDFLSVGIFVGPVPKSGRVIKVR